MYFKAALTIDPSEITKIEKIKPADGFKKILYFMTAGSLADKREKETFTAVSVLQQLYNAFSAVQIDNIIRLSHDDIDFYFDKKGIEGDFEQAMDKYVIEMDQSMSTYFKTLWMVLEHENHHFKYLIETSINRNHKVNEYPIKIVISGLLKEFQSGSKEEIREKMKTVFQSREKYEEFLNQKKLLFEQFASALRFEIQKCIRVDDIKMLTKQRVVLGDKKKEETPGKVQPPEATSTAGLPYGYFDFGSFFIGSLIWSELLHDFNMPVGNAEILSDQGDFITDIGDQEVLAGETGLFDYSEDIGDRVDAFSGDIMGDTDIAGGMEDVDAGDSWFDSDFDFGDFDFDLDI